MAAASKLSSQSEVGPEIEAFIARWSPSGGGERSNYQLFLAELCDVLGVPKPDPAVPDDARKAYVFDRSIPRPEADGSTTAMEACATCLGLDKASAAAARAPDDQRT